MKKLILTTVCAMAMSGAVFAQGYISWTTSSTYLTMQTNAVTISPLFGGVAPLGGTIGNTATTANGFDYILLTKAFTGTVSSDTSVWDGTWSALAAYNGGAGGALLGTNGISALQKGQVIPEATANGQTGTGVQVNWANGTTQNVVMVGWSADLGATWLGVSNILANLALGNNTPLLTQLNGATEAFFGETGIGYINPSAGTPGTPVFAGGADANGLTIDSLNTPLYLLPVPEPATMALAGLGGLSLLLFRRRRQ